jgi:hypothetical protein
MKLAIAFTLVFITSSLATVVSDEADMRRAIVENSESLDDTFFLLPESSTVVDAVTAEEQLVKRLNPFLLSKTTSI